ncbi:MAG: putative collagen-binding domain-containing protein, partial [Verrucomicrobiota bacterium]
GDPTWQTDKGKGIIGIVNYISSLGMNSYYFLTMNAFGDGQKAFPWNGQTDFYSYDVSKLDQWQIVFDYMMSQGVQCQFVLGETENQSIFEEFGTSTIFDDSRKLYYREMVARFGYLNAVIWNIGEENGWDQDTWNNENDYSQRIAFAQYVSDLLPYNDNITIHNGPATNDDIFGEFITNGTGAYRGISYQGPHDSSPIGHDRILKWINDSAASGSPWIVSFDEPFWNGNETVNPNEFPVWRKNSLWAAYSAGAAGVGLYLGGGRDITQEDLREFENYYTLIGNTAAFIDSVFDDLALTASADALVSSGWCLAETGDTYLVYLENGGMTTLDLSGVSGDFDVSWYDPRNYGNLQSGSVTSVTGGSVQSLGNAPNSPSDDWVIIVSKREVTVPFSARLEAEDASFVAGTLLSDPDASGSGTNNYVSGQQGFNITWMITVETAAMLDLNFRIKVASAGSNSSMELVVTDLTSGVQTSYGTLDTSSTSWEIQSASDILFPAGDYDIELRDTQGASEFDVDYLELSASTESVQSYRSAVQAAAAPSGWSFLRSSDSNIGNSSNYNSLNPQTNRYAVNSSVRGFYRDATAYARASNNQAIIAAYQVPTDGDYGIINSVIEFLDPATSKDVQLFVYLNDSLQLQTPVIVAGQTVTFDINLDDLLANDTIYVILETDNGGGPDDRLIFNYDIAEFPSAPVIENFRQTVMADPAPSGWSFLRSKNNNIGDATRYSALNTFPNRYAVNSTVRGFYRDATAYARPSSSRAIIAAYQTPVDGNYSIANSIIEYIDPLTNKDVSLYVYVNDIAILTSPLFVTGGQSQTFDLNLGALTAGDTIYIILQTSNGGGSNDQLFLDYNIVR